MNEETATRAVRSLDTEISVPSDMKRISVGQWISSGPFLSHIVVTRRCNLTCSYCNEYDRVSEPVPFDELIRRFRALQRLRTWVVCLTGGEPTMHPRLPELVAALTNMGIRRRQMITNGYRLTPELINQLNDSGLSDMQISIDGVIPTRETAKTLKPLRRRLEMLAKHAKFKVVISAVLGSAPTEEALEVIDCAESLGFIPRVLLLHDEEGRLNLSPSDWAAYENVTARLGRRVEDANEYRREFLKTGKAPFKCRAGGRYLYVDEFGDAHWCSQTRQLFSKSLESYTLQDLKEQFSLAKPCQENCTVGCVRTASQFDEWRGQRSNSDT